MADLDRARLTLRLRATSTKSGKTRIIPLRAALVSELWALRAVHQQARERMAPPTDPNLLTPEARPWVRETNNARRIFYRVLDRAGIARRSTDGVTIEGASIRSPETSPSTTSPGSARGTKTGPAATPSP